MHSFPQWHDADGKIIACTEKIKVMQQNMSELQQMAQDAFEDALLMQCDETQVREFLLDMMMSLINPYQK